MLPTIKDVARQAGVSTATVSRVLNAMDVVSEQTKLRVEQAIDDLGYQYNALARGLKMRESKLIGHIVPSIAGPVSPVLARAVEDQAQRMGYNVILCNSFENSEKEKANINILLERRVDGIIFSAPMAPEHLRLVRDRAVPMAIIERRTDLPGYYCIDPDNLKGAYDAVEHLIGLGHKQVAMIVGPPSAIISRMRLDGYTKALSDAGLSASADLIAEGNYSRASGYEAMQRFLELNPRPTAVFAANDAMAIGAMQAASDVGLSIPGDVSFVGFDDTYSELTIPQLTSVHQPLNEIGMLAMKIVEAQIRSEPGEYPLENMLPCTLTVRKSCGPAPK